MKIKLSIELTEKDLENLLLPNGGKVTSIELAPERVRKTRTIKQEVDSSPKPKTPRKKTAPKEKA